MKRILSVLFMASLAGAGTLQAAESPSLEACVRYAEADYAYEADVFEPLAVYARAAYLAAYRSAWRKAFPDAEDALQDSLDAALQDSLLSKAVAKQISGDEYLSLYGDNHSSFHMDGLREWKAVIAAAELKWLATDFVEPGGKFLGIMRWDNSWLKSPIAKQFSYPMSSGEAAAQKEEAAVLEAEAAYEVAKLTAEAARHGVYIDVYDEYGRIRSDVRRIMVKLRRLHRNLCLELYDL